MTYSNYTVGHSRCAYYQVNDARLSSAADFVRCYLVNRQPQLLRFALWMRDLR